VRSGYGAVHARRRAAAAVVQGGHKGRQRERMKVAIVGGNLTGCATAHYLQATDKELLSAYEARARASSNSSGILPPPPEKHEVTIFDKRSKLGGHKFVSEVVEAQDVEVGKFTCLHSEAAYMEDVLAEKKDLERDSYWKSGTGGRTVRSFAVYNWVYGNYSIRHGGFLVLDLLSRILGFGMVRLFFFAVSTYMATVAHGSMRGLPRLIALVRVLILFVVFVVAPRPLLGWINRLLAFVVSTLIGFFSYGMTIAVARGAIKGFVKHFKHMLEYNATSKGITLGHLINRCGLGSYSTHDAEQSFRSFGFYVDYVHHFAESQICCDYADSEQTTRKTSTLAGLLCLQRADVMEGEKMFRIKGGNARLCVSLAERSRQMLSSTVTGIRHGDREGRAAGRRRYTVTYRIPAQTHDVEEDFDAVIIACVPDLEELTVEYPGSEPEKDFGLGAPYVRKPSQNNTSRWLAVVAGTLDHRYFNHIFARTVPDLIVATECREWSRLECAGESDQGKVYTLHCADEPVVGEGIVAKLFTNVRDMRARRRISSKYTCGPLSDGVNADDVPAVILSTRLIYAAAIDRIACDPETDLMAARNAASLFSVGVDWKEDEEGGTSEVNSASRENGH